MKGHGGRALLHPLVTAAACAREAPQPVDGCALALSALQCSLPGGEREDTGHGAFRAPAHLPLLSKALLSSAPPSCSQSSGNMCLADFY